MKTIKLICVGLALLFVFTSCGNSLDTSSEQGESISTELAAFSSSMPSGSSSTVIYTPTESELDAMDGVIAQLPSGYRPLVLDGRAFGLILITDNEAKGGEDKDESLLVHLSETEAVERVVGLLNTFCLDYMSKEPERYRAEAQEIVGQNKNGVKYSNWFVSLCEIDGNDILRNTITAEVDECGRVYTINLGTPSTTPDEDLAVRSYIPKGNAVEIALAALEKEGISISWDIYETFAQLSEKQGIVRWIV